MALTEHAINRADTIFELFRHYELKVVKLDPKLEDTNVGLKIAATLTLAHVTSWGEPEKRGG